MVWPQFVLGESYVITNDRLYSIESSSDVEYKFWVPKKWYKTAEQAAMEQRASTSTGAGAVADGVASRLGSMYRMKRLTSIYDMN